MISMSDNRNNEARAYRSLGFPSSLNLIFKLCVCTLMPMLLQGYLISEISLHISKLAIRLINGYFPDNSIRLLFEKSVFEQNLYFAQVGNFSNTEMFLHLNLVLTAVFILCVYCFKTGLGTFYFLAVGITHFIACLFFELLPEAFPYTANDYLNIYMQQQMVIFFSIPLVLGVPCALMLKSPLKGLCCVAGCILFGGLFSVLRYALVIYVLTYVSILYLPVIYFYIGPVMDFFYMIIFYSFAVRMASCEHNYA